MSVGYWRTPALFGSAYVNAAYADPATTVSGAVTSQITSLILGLALVLAVIAACAWLLKRIAPRTCGNSGSLRIVAGAAVGPRERVVVVEIGATWLVLGVAAGTVNALHQMPRLDAPTDIQHESPAHTPFAAWLKQIMEKRGGR